MFKGWTFNVWGCVMGMVVLSIIIIVLGVMWFIFDAVSKLL